MTMETLIVVLNNARIAGHCTPLHSRKVDMQTVQNHTEQPLYPEIQVRLVGENGDAFAIMGRVQKALKRGGVSSEDRTRFLDEAMSGDYDNLLRVVMQWVDVDE